MARQKPRSQPRDMMTVREVADELDASTMTVYRLVHQGVLPAYRVSTRSLRIRRSAFEQYLRQHKVEGDNE